jgi:uroporphyrinogen-III synthase
MQQAESRLTQVSRILVTQARPTDDKSPYFDLANNYNLAIDFRPFIEIQGLTARDFRRQKVNIAEHTAVIFTSRNAIDHFFRLCLEMRVDVSAEMKYFCISEQTANYLQKYIVIRKRKIFSGTKTAAELLELIKKHKGEKFLFPCSNIRRNDIPEFMDMSGFHFTEAVMYETVPTDLSDLDVNSFDVIAFFSPSGVSSLLTNFPDFKQNGIRLAAFGPTTAKAITSAGLIVDIEAPLPNAPSMTGALDLYVKKANNL